MKFGKKIRLIREKRGLTARRLASLVDCTPSFISQIENDMANPSINTLKKISVILEVPIVEFFEEEEMNTQNTENFIVRKNNRKKLRSRNEGVEVSLLTPTTIDGKDIEMSLMSLAPGGKSEKLYQNNSDEIGYVLKGEITIILGDNRCHLEEGDTIYFPGSIPHGWENNTNEESLTLWAVTPGILGKVQD